MARFTRGFTGRRPHRRRRRLPPGQYDTGRDVAGAHRRGHARSSTPTTWTFAVEGLVERPDHVDVGRDPRPPAVDLRGRHPLRHHVVEVRHDVRRRLGRHAARRRAARCRSATHVLAFSPHRLHHQPAAGRRHRRQGVGRLGGRRRAAAASTTAARPGCSCPTSTSGRAPSGSPGLRAARPRRARLLGAQRLPRPRRPLARAALPGRLSVTDATAPPRRRRWQTPRSSASRDETARAKTFRLALAAPAPHLAGQHYVVRLTAPDGYTASRSYSVASPPDDTERDRAHRRAARRTARSRRSCTTRRAGRRARGARPDRRLVRVGRRRRPRCWSAAARASCR